MPQIVRFVVYCYRFFLDNEHRYDPGMMEPEVRTQEYLQTANFWRKKTLNFYSLKVFYVYDTSSLDGEGGKDTSSSSSSSAPEERGPWGPWQAEAEAADPGGPFN